MVSDLSPNERFANVSQKFLGYFDKIVEWCVGACSAHGFSGANVESINGNNSPYLLLIVAHSFLQGKYIQDYVLGLYVMLHCAQKVKNTSFLFEFDG